MLRSMPPEIHTRLHPPTRADYLPEEQATIKRQQEALQRHLALNREQTALCIRFELRDSNRS